MTNTFMKVINRRAFFDYQILEKFEAGINLTGQEVKSVKGGHMSLGGSFVKIVGSEAYLVNSQIHPYINARIENYDPKRTRKLLLHKKEIISIKSKIDQSNLTLVPLECYNTTHGLLKLTIGLAKGKKQYEKREALRKKDLNRQAEEELRNKPV